MSKKSFEEPQTTTTETGSGHHHHHHRHGPRLADIHGYSHLLRRRHDPDDNEPVPQTLEDLPNNNKLDIRYEKASQVWLRVVEFIANELIRGMVQT